MTQSLFAFGPPAQLICISAIGGGQVQTGATVGACACPVVRHPKFQIPIRLREAREFAVIRTMIRARHTCFEALPDLLPDLAQGEGSCSNTRIDDMQWRLCLINCVGPARVCCVHAHMSRTFDVQRNPASILVTVFMIGDLQEIYICRALVSVHSFSASLSYLSPQAIGRLCCR